MNFRPTFEPKLGEIPGKRKALIPWRDRIRLTMKACLVLLVYLSFTSCNEENPIEPQIFIFNYRILSVENGNSIVANVQSGTTTVANIMGSNPCNFALNFNPESLTTIIPQQNVAGTPGQRGFNISLTTTNAIHIDPQSIAAGCEIVKDLNFQVGTLSATVNLGEPTSIGNLDLSFISNLEYPDVEFFSATITGFNQSTQRASGTFSILKRNVASNPNRLLVIDGSFAFNDR